MPNYSNTNYDIGKAFAAIEDELMASMIRNLKRHKLEEIAEDKQWSMWQAEQLKSLERYKKENQKKYGKQFASLNSQIAQLLKIARQEGGMTQEITILNAIKNGFTGAKKLSAGATAEFFKLNNQKLNALIKATTSDMQKAETAVLRMANDQYRRVIYNAQVYANTGAGTYEKAVDMATKDFLSRGLNCIQYKNGARHTIADYADMAIRTASKRAYLQGEGEKRQEWGISTVIINKRGNPCPLCLPFVGKVFIDDVWSGGKKSDRDYPLLSGAIAKGLYHPRCKDSHTTYFPGISTADDTWTQRELNEIDKVNKTMSNQQKAALMEDRFSRLARLSLSPENAARNAAQAEAMKKQKEEALMKGAIKFPDINKADAYHRPNTEKIWTAFSKKERESLWKYTGSTYSSMNKALRTNTVSSQPKSIQDYISNMTDALNKCSLDDDIWVRRGVSVDGLAGLFNVDASILTDKKFQNQIIDKMCTEKGFMSTGVAKGAGFSGINLELCLPKGSKAIYAEPFSQYGGTNTNGTWDGLQEGKYIGGEAELIVQRGSNFKVKEIKTDSTGKITDVILLLISQTP